MTGEFLARDDGRGDRVAAAALGARIARSPAPTRMPVAISMCGTDSRPSACTSPKPVSWS